MVLGMISESALSLVQISFGVSGDCGPLDGRNDSSCSPRDQRSTRKGRSAKQKIIQCHLLYSPVSFLLKAFILHSQN